MFTRSNSVLLAMLLVLAWTQLCFARTAHLIVETQSIQVGENEVVCRSLGELRDLLKEDVGISEVIVHDGEHVGGCSIAAIKGVDYSDKPLLIRAAEGASPVCVGSMALSGAKLVEGKTDVYELPYHQVGNEMPKLWDPTRRVRYRYVADVTAVEYFPASFTIESGKLYVKPFDGAAIEDLRRNHPYLDYAFFITRPNTTVRGIKFRDYRLREKWSTGIQARASNITIEDCEAINCSIGFTIAPNGNNCVVRNTRVEDCGGGIYVGGENAVVENCKVFKIRDLFRMPMYHQDDTGIQFYYPAKGGVIRGNLCVGFARGIFIKAHSSDYVIEHNTIDGSGYGDGFACTKWREGEQLRYNIFYNCKRPYEVPADATDDAIHHNLIYKTTLEGYTPIAGKGTVSIDPRFVNAHSWDYRLSNDSPALAIKQDGRPCGAFGAIGNDSPSSQVVERNDASLATESIDMQNTPTPKRASDQPQQWYIAQQGKDTNAGSKAAPLRTIQAAINAAIPGDEIIVLPGVYPHPVQITKSGTADAPITIRAAEKWQAKLDGGRVVPRLIEMQNTSHIIIRDLELRWYGSHGISLHDSSHITVEGCRIWNANWFGTWATGRAVYGNNSPHFTGHRNVFFAQEYGFWFSHSPHMTLTHNTCAGHVYAAASIRESIEGTVCINNSFAYQGNDVMIIQARNNTVERMKQLVCDYNNYGTSIRAPRDDTPFDDIDPREKDRCLDQNGKAIVQFDIEKGDINRKLSMDAWRKASGKDIHTLFADPLYVDAFNRDFRLQPDSPNIGAGKDGATIGALGVATSASEETR